MKKIITLLLLFSTLSIFGSTISLKKLNQEIELSKNLGNHEACIKLVCNFLAQPNITSAEKYEAYVLKSAIYRRLYKYEHALHFLDLALKEGIKGDNRATAEQEIKAERSFTTSISRHSIRRKNLQANWRQQATETLSQNTFYFFILRKGIFY